jgi:hypothetical protein
MKSKLRTVITATIAATVALSQAYPLCVLETSTVSAAAAQKTTPSVTAQKVKLSTNSFLNLRDAQFLMQDQGKIVTFTLTITNNEKKSLNLLDYWVRLSGASSKFFSVKQVGGDAAIKTIRSKSTADVTFYAVVDDNTKINDLKFNIIKWDFKSANYEKKLGVIQYPKGITEKIQPYKDKVMLYDNGKLRSAIKSYELNANEDNTSLSIDLLLENSGFKSSNLGKMKFFIQTNNQTYVYDVSTEDLTKIILQPKGRKIIKLNAILPVKMTTKDMVLVAAQTGEGPVPNLPIGAFTVPTNKPTSEPSQPQGKIGSSYKYKDFTITLTSIHRIYSDNQDSLVANVQVKNSSATSKELPNLSGYLLVNGVKIAENLNTTTNMDQNNLLSSNQSYNYVVYANIASATSINQVGLVVTEISTESQTTTSTKVYSFSDNMVSEVSVSEAGSVYSINNIGQSAEVKFLNSAIYEGDKFDHFYGEVEYKNKEKRANTPAELAGYLQSLDKAIIPVTFSTYTEKIFPDGKVLLSVYAKVPKNYVSKNMKLTIGQSPKKADSTPKSSSVFVKPISYPVVESGVFGTKVELTEIHYLNYLINFENFYTSLHGNIENLAFDGLNLSFYYDVFNIDQYENGSDNHKLLIEFVDSKDARVSYSKEISINEVKQDAELLTVGERIGKSITFMDPDVIKKLSMSKYKVNIYHVYQQNKMLLASKEMIW